MDDDQEAPRLPPRVETAFAYLAYIADRAEVIPIEDGRYIAPVITDHEQVVHHRAVVLIDDHMSGRLPLDPRTLHTCN